MAVTAKFESVAAEGGRPMQLEYTMYPDAGHGSCCDHRPAAFNPTACEDATAKTLAIFKKHL